MDLKKVKAKRNRAELIVSRVVRLPVGDLVYMFNMMLSTPGIGSVMASAVIAQMQRQSARASEPPSVPSVSDVLSQACLERANSGSLLERANSGPKA